MKKLAALITADFRNVSREPVQIFTMAAPLLILAFIRFAVPLVTTFLDDRFGFDLTPHHRFIVAFLTLIPPMMVGMVVGMIILDDRDEDILSYLRVTPLTQTQYLLYRVSSSALVGFLAVFLITGLSGIASFDLVTLLPAAVLAALEGPMMALFLGAFAGNKVEGMALAKAVGVLYFAPAAAYFIPAQWTLVLGIAPPYWVTTTLMHTGATTPRYWFLVAAGIIVHLVVLAALQWKFVSRIR